MDLPTFRRVIKAFWDKTYDFRNKAEFVRFLRLYIDPPFTKVTPANTPERDPSSKLLVTSSEFSANATDNFTKTIFAEEGIYS